MRRQNAQSGFALLTMLVLLALLGGLIMTHFSLTWIEMSTTQSSMNSFVGFYAAEAGLNVRADLVRQAFVGYSQPSGTSPDTSSGTQCEGANNGTGDFACANYKFQEREVITWVEETGLSGNPIVIPRGERYKNLHGHEHHYVVYSNAMSPKGHPEAVLEMHFKSRIAPLFQFAAFYDKDLEILPGPDLFLEGPVHSQGDLYVGSDNTLDVMGQLTLHGGLYHGRKDADACLAGDVRIADPDDQTAIPACSSGRTAVPQSSADAWNGMIHTGLTPLTLPPADMTDPTPGKAYWHSADVRIMLDLHGTPAIEVRDENDTVDGGPTAVLAACGAAGQSSSFYDNREALTIDMLEIDVEGLIDCLHGSGVFDIGDASDGGMVWYLGVDGPSESVLNNYGVRVTNGSELASTDVSAPAVAGLTIVTDQALYVQGDYNSVNKIPAALIADSLNVLSNNWSNDAYSSDPFSSGTRAATATTIQAAMMAGTDSTGGAEGAGGRDSGGYNGGLENFMRLHEDWNGVTLTYVGSFVSLNSPRHVDGAWAAGDPYYNAPTADWSFDLDFEDPLLIPPLSPTFVYLRQELFVRQFEL